MKPPSLSLWSAWWEGGFGTETKDALSTTRWHWIAFPESWPPKTFPPVLLIPLKVLLSNMSAPQTLPFICWGSYKVLTDFGSLFRPIRCLARGQQALQGSAVVTGAVHQRLGDELPAFGAPGLSRETGQMVQDEVWGPLGCWRPNNHIAVSSGHIHCARYLAKPGHSYLFIYLPQLAWGCYWLTVGASLGCG